MDSCRFDWTVFGWIGMHMEEIDLNVFGSIRLDRMWMDLNGFGGNRLEWIRVGLNGLDVDGSECIWRKSIEMDSGRFDWTGCGWI